MNLGDTLTLVRCPHCNVDNPYLQMLHALETADSDGKERRDWKVYVCRRCGNLVTAYAWHGHRGIEVIRWFPEKPPAAVDHDSIPVRARSFIKQAVDSRQAPAGAVMLAASAVDSMLKSKGYVDGSLYSRIDKAAADHVITPEMAQWAHSVRLDANDQRHADESAPLPNGADAQRSIDFVNALALLMFILPARVAAGIGEANP